LRIANEMRIFEHGAPVAAQVSLERRDQKYLDPAHREVLQGRWPDG